VLHTIFFHRYFPSIRPCLRDLPHLDITLPHIADPPEIETLIDGRTSALVHQLTSANTPNSGVRGQIAIQFFEKKRRKTGWLGGMGRGGDEEVCWEEWLLEVTIAKPKTESGTIAPASLHLTLIIRWLLLHRYQCVMGFKVY
jgi:autophagy-related protein 101